MGDDILQAPDTAFVYRSPSCGKTSLPALQSALLWRAAGHGRSCRPSEPPGVAVRPAGTDAGPCLSVKTSPSPTRRRGPRKLHGSSHTRASFPPGHGHPGWAAVLFAACACGPGGSRLRYRRRERGRVVSPLVSGAFRVRRHRAGPPRAMPSGALPMWRTILSRGLPSVFLYPYTICTVTFLVVFRLSPDYSPANSIQV